MAAAAQRRPGRYREMFHHRHHGRLHGGDPRTAGPWDPVWRGQVQNREHYWEVGTGKWAWIPSVLDAAVSAIVASKPAGATYPVASYTQAPTKAMIIAVAWSTALPRRTSPANTPPQSAATVEGHIRPRSETAHQGERPENSSHLRHGNVQSCEPGKLSTNDSRSPDPPTSDIRGVNGPQR